MTPARSLNHPEMSEAEMNAMLRERCPCLRRPGRMARPRPPDPEREWVAQVVREVLAAELPAVLAALAAELKGRGT